MANARLNGNPPQTIAIAATGGCAGAATGVLGLLGRCSHPDTGSHAFTVHSATCRDCLPCTDEFCSMMVIVPEPVAWSTAASMTTTVCPNGSAGPRLSTSPGTGAPLGVPFQITTSDPPPGKFGTTWFPLPGYGTIPYAWWSHRMH